jgi:long-chain acyl-CoA synthetase
MAALCNPHEWTASAIGGLPTSVEIKLVSCPDLGYLAANNQGEIHIRGPAVATAYYNDPTETMASFTRDGWFKTGDIGEWNSNGHLKIVDRIKNLVKLANGEYIALEKVINTFCS